MRVIAASFQTKELIELFELNSNRDTKPIPQNMSKVQVIPEAGRKVRHKHFDIAYRIWTNSDLTLGNDALAYFRSRGLTVPDDCIGRVFRYDSRGRWGSTTGQIAMFAPMLIAVTRDVSTDAGYAIHRTRLPHLGKRPDRRWLGDPSDSAIKLTPHEDVMASGKLTICEGWETGLAALMLGFSNVWALGTANGIASLPVLDGINELTILGEHCRANEAARIACAVRWKAAKRRVTIALPDLGKDHNDELVELIRKGEIK
jgi:hypothetical protein